MSDGAQSPTVALVGVGSWGRHILRDLKTLGCRVHVVARSAATRERAAALADSIVDEVSALPPCDGAVAAPVTTSHVEVIRDLADHLEGPIYVEKPLSDDLVAATELANDLSDRLFVMDKWRYHPGILELARIAQSGELGELQSIHCRRVTTQNNHPDVNTVWTHAPHDLAIALEILGELPPLRSSVGEYTAGELGGAFATLGGPPWVNIEISVNAPAHRRETRIVCERGSAHLDGGWAEQVVVREVGKEDRVVETPGELPLLAELRAFVEHLNGGPPPKSTAREGLAQVRRIDEMIRAANEAEGL